MRDLVRFTARTFDTRFPSPFGALIVHTQSGKELMRATNAVMREHDPSSHAEVRAVRLACKKLKRPSLAGYTMYSTCEPCPMCMANALWARLDRVVYGATIEDANRHSMQIHIPARKWRAARTWTAWSKALCCASCATRYSTIRECKRPSKPGAARRKTERKREHEPTHEPFSELASRCRDRFAAGRSVARDHASADGRAAFARLLLVFAGAAEAARRQGRRPGGAAAQCD